MMDEVVLEPYIYIYIYCQLFFLVFLNSFGGSSSLSNYVVLCVIIFVVGHI